MNNGSITPGSGNIFADLGLPGAEERNTKGLLASRIYMKIKEKAWTQTHAAEQLGISQPDVSRLLRGLLTDFSVERLLCILAKLDYRVSIRLQDENSTEDIDLYP